MPGGKKKKASQKCSSQWPPLTFVSSPLYQPAPVLEIDSAVDNPVTAKSVCVDDLSSTVWVSPQFSKRKPRSSSCRGINTTKRATQQTNSGRKLRFKPLGFLKDSVEEDSTAALSSNRSKPSDANRTEFQENSTNALKDCGEIAHAITGKENNGLEEQEEVDHLQKPRPFETLSDNKLSNESNTPDSLRSSPLSRACHRTRRTGSFCSDKNLRSHHPVLRICKSDTDLMCSKQPCDPAVLSNSFDVCETDNLHHLKRNSQELSASGSAAQLECRNSVLTVPLGDICHLPSGTGTPPKLLSNTPSKVLAYDTPVCDYSLTLRQRQLKYGISGKL